MLRNIVLLLFTLSLTPVFSSAADAPKQQITKEQATKLAQQHYPGKIVKVNTDSRYYRVRVLQSDGRVITVLVDSKTGQIHRDD